MKARLFILPAVVTVGLIFLSSCSDAIFATIETEKKVTENTLPLLMSVFDIETTNPGVAGGPYYVAAGAVFQGILPGPGAAVSWTPSINDSSRPFNPPGTPLCNAMALFGGKLWGGFITSSGAASLYQSDLTFSFGSGHGTPQAVPTSGEQVTVLQAANGYLFVGGATAAPGSDYVFRLDASSTPPTWGAPVMTGLAKPISGVGFDGINYWFASGSTVYESNAAGGPYSVVTPTGISTDTINGLFADGANLTHTTGVVIILTKTKGVFYTTNSQGVTPSTWLHINADMPQGSANPASYLCAAGPVDPSSKGGADDLYLVGSDGNNTIGFGYYTLSLSAGTLKRFSDTTILLYSSSVSHILVDGENVLMGTNYNGLWRAVFNQTNGQVLSGSNQYWIHE